MHVGSLRGEAHIVIGSVRSGRVSRWLVKRAILVGSDMGLVITIGNSDRSPGPGEGASVPGSRGDLDCHEGSCEVFWFSIDIESCRVTVEDTNELSQFSCRPIRKLAEVCFSHSSRDVDKRSRNCWGRNRVY